jgi:hypothetical protein
VYKKNPNVRFDIKTGKDSLSKVIEFKTTDKELYNEISKEINITTKFVDMNISPNDPFLTDESGLSLKALVNSMEIDDYNVMKIDENHVSIRLIGREVSLIKFERLISEYIKSLSDIQEAQLKLDQLKRSNKSF